MGRHAVLVLRLVIWVGHGGCAYAPPEGPMLDFVEPSRGLVDRLNPMTLHGRNLHAGIDERDGQVVSRSWQGSIGRWPLLALREISPEKLEAIVPPGVVPGVHEVVLKMGDREARLVGAYVSVEPLAPVLVEIVPKRIPLTGGFVHLSGVGFHFGSSVHVDGRVTNTHWLDEQALAVEIPPGPAGPVRVEVQTPVGRLSRDDFLFRVPL